MLFRSAKPYTNVHEQMREAFVCFRNDVEALRFPAPENAMHMQPDKLQQLQALLQSNGEKS